MTIMFKNRLTINKIDQPSTVGAQAPFSLYVEVKQKYIFNK